MELLLTVLTLLAAIYAIVPRERQLDLQLRIGVASRIVFLFGCSLILCLEFYEFLEAQIRWLPEPSRWPTGITPKNAIYLVMLVFAAAFWFMVRFTHLTKGRILKFRELIEELYWTESYGELFAMLQKHLTELFRIYNSDFVLSRLRQRLTSLRTPTVEDFDRFIKELDLPAPASATALRKRTRRRFFDHALRPVAPAIRRFLPEYDQAKQTARELVRGIFLSNKFLEALARTRPYLGLEIIRQSKSSFERLDFVNLYMKELLRDSQSVLYTELHNNQNISTNRYFLSESNRIIYFFLADVRVAKDNNVYKPIGDYCMAHLDELGRDSADDPYNRAMGDFEEVGAWHSPVFATIRWFDIMVREALFQGMPWHMWLYYMPLIVKRIERNYRLGDPLADENSEFPIIYSFLLYRIFSSMCDWVTAIEEIPPDQPNVVLHSARPDGENDNIPKSSIIALSECAYSLLVSANVGERVKRSLMNMIFELYFELRCSGKFNNYAAVLLAAISKGANYRRDNKKYRSILADLFEKRRTNISSSIHKSRCRNSRRP